MCKTYVSIAAIEKPHTETKLCCSVAKLCLILSDLMSCSAAGFPVLHHLPEFVQTHVL